MKIPRPLFLLPFCATLALAAPADWPQWRGPNRDGVSPETGLLKEWPADGPPLAWKMTGLGKGLSSVTIVGGKLFTMASRKGGQYIVALNLATQQELWAAKVSDKGGEPRCTPTIADGLAYGVSTEGDLVCVDTADGHEVWRKNFASDFGGKMMSGWLYSESPLVDGEKLIVTPGGKDAALVALNRKTGALIWKTELPNLGNKGSDGAGYTGAVISNAAGVRQYVQLLGRGVVGVNAEDGKLLWSYNRIANNTANIPTPLAWDDYVFCSTGYGTGAALLKIVKTAPTPASDNAPAGAVPGSPVEMQEQYFLKASTFQNTHGGMIRIGDYIYAGTGHNNGFPICIEWKTGKVAWSQNRGPGSESAAIVAADGELYFRYQNAVMALIDASPTGYVQKGAFPLASHNGESWSHPVIQDGHLYLRDQDVLMCYDVRKK